MLRFTKNGTKERLQLYNIHLVHKIAVHERTKEPKLSFMWTFINSQCTNSNAHKMELLKGNDGSRPLRSFSKSGLIYFSEPILFVKSRPLQY